MISASDRSVPQAPATLPLPSYCTCEPHNYLRSDDFDYVPRGKDIQKITALAVWSTWPGRCRTGVSLQLKWNAGPLVRLESQKSTPDMKSDRAEHPFVP